MADDGVKQTSQTQPTRAAQDQRPPHVQASFEMAEQLGTRFGGDVELVPTPFDIPVVKVRPDALRDVARFLKEQGYAMLLDVGGVDYLGRRPAEERFEVVYHLLDIQRLRRIRLRVVLPQDDPALPSLSDLWPSASWAEREAFDLFGIRFTGHPKLKRILMPDDWEGHPLRKDYPLRGPQRSAGPQALRQRFFPLRLDSPPPDGAGSAGPSLAPGAPGSAPHPAARPPVQGQPEKDGLP